MRYQKPGHTKIYQEYEYVVTSAGVTIVGSVGEEACLELPAFLPLEEGKLPVTALAPYAFYDHRELVQVKIPDSVSSLGDHCFYECRNLEELWLSDRIRDVEDGAFKNCERLSRVRIRMLCHRSSCIKGILREQNRRLELTLDHIWTGQEPVPRARLILPRYQLDYEANVEARIINQITYGSGIHYRECLTEADFDYREYDRCFEVAQMQDTPDTLIRLCVCRLAYPWQLLPERARAYREYLARNLRQVVEWACGRERMDVLEVLAGQGLLEKEEQVQEALDAAHASGKIPYISYLMEYRSRKMGGRAQEPGEGRCGRKGHFTL